MRWLRCVVSEKQTGTICGRRFTEHRKLQPSWNYTRLPSPSRQCCAVFRKQRRCCTVTAVLDEKEKLSPVREGRDDLDRDNDKEESRKYRRTVFTYERWASHRSTNRYFRHLRGLVGSRIVRGLQTPLIAVAGISCAVCVYQAAFEAGNLPYFFPDVAIQTTEPFNLTSFALSLLLVFRTNASYARWLDARKLWGGVVNRSRDLMRQGLTYFPHEEVMLRDMLRRWSMVFPKVLMVHLREDGNFEREVVGILLPEEVARLRMVEHKPNYVLRVLSELICQANVGQQQQSRMDENLTFFADALGSCERILRTPIPLSYTRHTSRFLVVWMLFLPFTLWTGCSWGTIPISVVVAFMLLGIEEIGVQIEEPFGILALENISSTIVRNVKEMAVQSDDVFELVQAARSGLPSSADPLKDEQVKFWPQSTLGSAANSTEGSGGSVGPVRGVPLDGVAGSGRE